MGCRKAKPRVREIEDSTYHVTSQDTSLKAREWPEVVKWDYLFVRMRPFQGDN